MKLVKEINSELWVHKWPHVRLDMFNNIEMMSVETMDLFNKMCEEAMFTKNWQHIINSDYRKGDTGFHGKGEAIDTVFYIAEPGDVNLIEQLIFALRFNFGGVGFYPYWNTPGLHIDTRAWEVCRALWWYDGKNYHRGDVLFEKLKWIA